MQELREAEKSGTCRAWGEHGMAPEFNLAHGREGVQDVKRFKEFWRYQGTGGSESLSTE